MSASSQQFHLARHKDTLQSTLFFRLTITAAFLPDVYPRNKSVEKVEFEKQENINYFVYNVPWKSNPIQWIAEI